MEEIFKKMKKKRVTSMEWVLGTGEPTPAFNPGCPARHHSFQLRPVTHSQNSDRVKERFPLPGV